MKIAYGLFGYGQGHATRALSVLPLLERHHDVMLLSSGDALHALSPYRVYELPNLRYEYNAVGERCLFRTARAHATTIADGSVTAVDASASRQQSGYGLVTDT